MYIESKAHGLTGSARIGRVTFSKTGKTLSYGGRSFQSLKGGYEANYFDVESGEELDLFATLPAVGGAAVLSDAVLCRCSGPKSRRVNILRLPISAPSGPTRPR